MSLLAAKKKLKELFRYCVAAQKIIRFMLVMPELEKLPEDGPVARLYELPGALGQVGIISPLSCQFCDRCDRIRLTADGRIKPCLHQRVEYPLKGLDEAGMQRQFEAAILNKPPWHGELSSAAPSQAGRTMDRIGG